MFRQKRHYGATAVASCAVASRIATLALMMLSNQLLPTHNATGVHLFRPAEYPVPAPPGAGGPLATFTRWDSAWFLSIADSGYPARRSAAGTIDCTGTERAWGGGAYRLEVQAGAREGELRCRADVALLEQAHAFFPLYPWLVRALGGGLSLSLSGLLGRGDCLILAAVFISNASFVAAAVLLYHLGRVVTGDALLAFGGALVFCASPASVFFSTAYAGSLYSALTFAGLLALYAGGHRRAGRKRSRTASSNKLDTQGAGESITRCTRGWQGMVRAWVAAALFAAATLARSNGIAAAGVLVLEKVRWMANEAGLFAVSSTGTVEPTHGVTTRAAATKRNQRSTLHTHSSFQWSKLPWARLWASLIATGLQALLVIAPYVTVQVYAYRKFCCFDIDDHSPAAELMIPELHPWCVWRVPSLYAYIQSTYWGVGALKYYEWKQIPNFLLAAPALALTAFGTARFFAAQFERAEESNSGVCEEGAVENGTKKGQHLWCSTHMQRIAAVFFGSPVLPYPAAKPFERSGAAALVLQWAFLGTFAAVFMNVQVTTRFLAAACPPFHWWTASLLFPARASGGNARGSDLIRSSVRWYFALYFLVGALLHPKFLPWT